MLAFESLAVFPLIALPSLEFAYNMQNGLVWFAFVPVLGLQIGSLVAEVSSVDTDSELNTYFCK